ncbi:cation ABC transporter substrate-binding protein [Thioclava sp. BHET1]|nr:cation ABC transporter substrate-binding protein [Thioclava sp. BHET1]
MTISSRAALLLGASLALAPLAAAAAPKTLHIVGVENEYADVAAQIGGAYVTVSAIMSDPNTDPHSFEASPKIAQSLASADLVIENGAGYDDWAAKLLSATHRADRKILNVQELLGKPSDIANPHLWFDPATMPKVAAAIEATLSARMPAHAATFKANLTRFDTAMKDYQTKVAAFAKAHPGVSVAVTEPVADYLLQALDAKIETPQTLEMAAMNDTDPAPQDVAAQEALFSGKKVKVFVYNQQVTDALTDSFLAEAKKNGIPVVGVYETMPTPGFSYQSWMTAELAALEAAVTTGRSTETLVAGK